MTDSTSRRGSLRLPRVRGGNSRSSSIRSSAVLDDLRQPSGPRPLRNVSSRFSLNEQFAATRQEYELWDDDASSVLERATNASQAGDVEGDKILVSSVGDFGVVYNAEGLESSSEARDWDYYDILCLPRATKLSQDQIRRAYYRLFLLFHPSGYPEHLRPMASQHFLRAQEAFEALIDPARRAQYEIEQFESDWVRGRPSYEVAFEEAFRDRIQDSIQTSSDLGVRLDATRTARRGREAAWESEDAPLKLLDFALSHSVAVNIPLLQHVLQPQVSKLERLVRPSEVEGFSEATVELSTPTITVSGSVYGVTPDWSLLPTALLFDRYQPLLPLTISRPRLIQLVENRLSPLVTLKYRQELLNRAPISDPGESRWVKTGVQVESDILPEPSITSRLYHHIALPNTSEPTILEASIKSPRTNLSQAHPRLALGIHQNLFHGSGFIRADSGDWTIRPDAMAQYPTDISSMNPTILNPGFPFETSPTLELGFRTTPLARISDLSTVSTAESGIWGLDHDVRSSPNGSWAISASATPTSLAGFLRYSKDLALPFTSPDPASLPSPVRLEVELCSNTLQDQYLALRNLWSVGRFARLGLEVGISQHSLHLSVYWSRLSQRIRLPLLISPRALFAPGVVLWAGALPFTALAAVQLFLQRRGHRRRRRRSTPQLSETQAQLAVARRRYEAENVTALLAQRIEARQKRQRSLGGLVILSARFGIPDEHDGLWAGPAVADVTIALAALIDDDDDDDDAAAAQGGRLVVPQGVRKSRVPGFWDPAPGREKTLHVVYSWKGAEGVVDVRGRDALVLPPPPPGPPDAEV